MLEPSMLGPQHITLLDAYLRALLDLDLAARGLDLIYRADPSSHHALSADVRSRVPLDPIRVVDPMLRRWIRKGLGEFRTVRATIRGLRPGDILLVTCVTAPALLLLELASKQIGQRNVTVVLHSELEALFDPSLRDPRRYGFWAWHWARLRRPASPLKLAVIANFIRDALQGFDAERFAPASVRVLPFPVADAPLLPAVDGRHRAVFIGYKTRFKGFDSFARVARASPDIESVVVGGGKIEAVPSRVERPLGAAGAYMTEIATATVAIFPYTQGYAAAQSAAALDAVAAGVHVLATRRACFVALALELGDDAVTLYDDERELIEILRDADRLARMRAGAAARRARLAVTAYGVAATRAAFSAMLLDAGYPAPAACARAAA